MEPFGYEYVRVADYTTELYPTTGTKTFLFD